MQFLHHNVQCEQSMEIYYCFWTASMILSSSVLTATTLTSGRVFPIVYWLGFCTSDQESEQLPFQNPASFTIGNSRQWLALTKAGPSHTM